MRENRTCGSEGGEAQSLPYPYPFPLGCPTFPSPILPAEYNSALVRPRWRVVSTVEVRAGVLP